MNDLEIEVIYLEQQNSKLQNEAYNWEEKYNELKYNKRKEIETIYEELQELRDNLKDVTNNFNDLDKLYNGVEQQCIIQQASIEKQAYIIEMLNKEIEKLKEEKELIYQVITVNNDKKESWE